MRGIAGRTTAEWRKIRKQCFQRDKSNNARCWICNGDIRYDLKPSSTPDSWEPDHRYSVSTHPELAEVPENILPSHKRCNRMKGAKAGINNLGTRSRDW